MAAKARKLLDRMRRSLDGWSRNDLVQLYQGFGFEIQHGAKHDRVRHPKYPQLLTHLPRHTSLAKGYIKEAIRLIDTLEELQQTEESDQ